ncbi:uncharacterized protein Tco025E_04397, partial [Trypanosoma conorhini]
MSDLSGTQPGTTPSPGEIAGERPAGDVSMEFGGLLPGLLLPEVRQRDSVNLEEDNDYSSDSSAGGPSQQRPQQQSPQQQSPQQQSPQQQSPQAQHEVRPVSRVGDRQ